MIMGGDKKKMASFIVDKIDGKKKDEAGKENNAAAFQELAAEPAPMVDEGMLAAAEEIQGALQGSPESLAVALQNFFDMCQGRPKEDYSLE